MSKGATGSILTDFISGAKKGVEVNLFSQVPNFIMAYCLIRVLQISGLLDLIGLALNPVMAIFGLPGEAGVVLITAFLSIPGAIGATSGLVEAGSLIGIHCAVLLPMIYCMGQQVQQLGRILAVAGTPKKYYLPCMVIAAVNSVIAGLIMRVVVGFFN